MNSLVDLFKLCKLPDLKELDKKGSVTVTHDKLIGRKVLSVQGNVSTANYIKLSLTKSKSPLSHRYLYMQCVGQPGHTFSFQLTVHSNGRIYKLHFSSLHKTVKLLNANTANIPLVQWPHSRWAILVVDLHEFAQQLISPNQIKLSFELAEIEFRATMKVKGAYLGHQLWSVEELPKDLVMPLHGNELFFEKYAYIVLGTHPNENINASNVVATTDKKPAVENEKLSAKKRPYSQHKRNQSNTKEESLQKESSKATGEQQLKKSKSNDKRVTFSEKIAEEQPKQATEVPKPSRTLSGRPPKQHSRQPRITNSSASQERTVVDNDDGVMEVAIMQPRPLPTLEASLMFHQGAKVAVGSYYTLGRYLFTPEPVETHKPISFFKQLSANLTIVAYDDGTVAYFDTMMKQPLKYFQTGLEIVTGLYPDKNGVLVLTGRDYMRRNVLMVVADNTILNKQISNYDIKGLLLFNNESYTHGLIAFGFENVRVWKVKKDVLSGSCIYLGEAVRKVSFNSGFMLTNERAYIVSSNGNLNVINVSKCTLEEAVSLDTIELDQIHQLDDHSFVVANSHGTVRVYSIAEFTLLLEIPLEHRIKYLHMNTPNELILTHYNNTLGKLLLSEAKYQFLMRGHSDSILSLHYQQMYKRLVTTSEDGSIRVWRIFADNLSQQYQFQINDDRLSSLVVLQNEMTFIAGFQSGLLRRFDMKEFRLTQERQHHRIGVVTMDVAPGDKYILSGDRDGTVYLMDDQLEILCEYEATPQDNLKVGFNRRGDSFFITTTAVEVTIFSTRTLKAIHTLYIDSVELQKIVYSGELLHVITASTHTIYRNHRFERMFKLEQHSALAVNFPLVVSCGGQSSLTMKILGSSVRQDVRVPEQMGGVVLPDNDDEGLLFAWGEASRAIYCWRIKARNLPRIEQIPQQLPDPDMLSDHHPAVNHSQELDVTFMGESVRTVQQPATLYQHETIQSTFLGASEEHQNRQFKENHLLMTEDENEFLEVTNIKPRQTKSSQKAVEVGEHGGEQPIPTFIYGFPAVSLNSLSQFVWNPILRCIILPSHEYLVVHYFTKPFKQKLIRLPYRPYQLKSTERFLSFTSRNCLSLYDSQSFMHFKSVTLEGNDILSYCFSNCSSYVITVSSHNSHRALIGVTEVASGRLITQSYLGNGQRPTILTNPYSQRIEFVVYTTNSLFYYRVTSIQTLEYQELLVGEVVSKTNGMSTARFVKLQSTELIMIGTVDGSLLVVDSRSATLLVLCKSVLKSPVLQIRYEYGMLLLLTNTINMFIWKEVHTIDELLEAVANKEPSILPLDSPISMVSQLQPNEPKMMVCSKLGVMWLVDPTQLLSIKVMCSHTKPVNCIDLVDSDTMVTGSDDATASLTCLNTLDQISSFYKPKKAVNCVKWMKELGMLVVGHGNLLGFYTLRDVLGSCTLQNDVCSIHHIPNTRCILVGTRTEVLMIYLHNDLQLKIEVKKLAEVKDYLLRLEVSQFEVYDSWLGSCRNGRINVWSRKCLKRLYNPVVELENIQELEYYLIDNYQPTAKSVQEVTAHFVSAVSYLCFNHETGRLQERNFKEHIILREIELFPAACFQIYEDRLLLATKSGQLAVVDQNGLTLSKQKLMEEGVRNLTILNKRAYLLGDRVICCHIG